MAVRRVNALSAALEPLNTHRLVRRTLVCETLALTGEGVAGNRFAEPTKPVYVTEIVRARHAFSFELPRARRERRRQYRYIVASQHPAMFAVLLIEGCPEVHWSGSEESLRLAPIDTERPAIRVV